MGWTTEKILFARPIEITSSNNTMTATVGGTPTALSLTTGVYPCLFPVILEANNKLSTVTTARFSYSGTTNLVTFTAGNCTNLAWTDTALRDMLGFTATLTTTTTATYQPQYTWFPSRTRSDVNDWVQDQGVQWRGVEARSGNVVGLRTGCTIYRTSLDFDALPDAEVLKSASTSEYQDVRNLEYFVEKTRETWGTIGLPSLGGFYYYWDTVNCDATIASSSYGNGYVTGYNPVARTPDCVFCNFDADYYLRCKQTIGSIRAPFYTCSVDIHTATAPTWTGA